MTTVFDVAKYILDNYGTMSAMKLQKLIFYSQAMSLVWDDVPLFEDDFEAWAKGPVCRALFNAHKGKFFLKNSDFLNPYKPNISNLSTEQKETINTVVDSLKDYPPYVLSDMVHKEKPWLEARGDLPQGARCQNIITKNSMLEYYLEHWT
ncbi:MAG: DUF4065 domain-containing protein [Selenomonadaceae bacterium]|nr:DUF4065 domain-containing protein [Selenomonadaceae bacterium]